MGALSTGTCFRPEKTDIVIVHAAQKELRINASCKPDLRKYREMFGLHLFGVHLPMTKTMIAITFIVGLLPIVGNLTSNTIVVVVSLAHSPAVALASLVFLIVIHKLEYFLGARIVGTRIKSQIWELLIAMLTLEAMFGLGGLIAAPVFYAQVKRTLHERGWL